MSDCKDPCTVPGEELKPDGSCGKCETGTAKVPPSTTCEICQAGFTTESTGSTKCVPDCKEGSYWDGTKCSLCPKAKYQPNKYQYTCEDCLTGLTTANVGSTSVDLCIDICPNGFELLFNGACGPCEKNYYRTQGEQLQCTACPKDFITLFEGAETSDDCHPPCGIGEEWDATASECDPCKLGFYQDQMYQKNCKQCDTGKITLNTGETFESGCVGNCGPGTYWNEVAGQCMDCAKGRYQSESYKDLCVPCIPGFTTDFPKSTSLADCLDKCQSGYTYDSATDSCKECGYHKYRDRDKHNVCHDCPPGLITVTAAATSEAMCVSRCSAGEYWNKDKRVCVQCDIGTYQPDTSTLQCIQCDDDWITLTTGATQISDCKPPCLEGEEWDATSKKCVPCPVGEYQDTKYEENCKPCGTGKSTQSIRSTQESDCESTTCGPGEWRCLSGVGCADFDERCDGIANDCADGSDESGCSCQSGEYFDTTSSQCKDCEKGTYQDQSGQLSCIQCPVGFTTAGEKTDSKSGCIEICDDGEKFDPAPPGACVQCPVGTYRKKGTDNPETCTTCPTPFTTENTGAADIGDCVPKCAKGEYYKELPNAGCTECSLGYYQDQEYNQYLCTKCSPGTTTTTVAAQDQSQCTDVCDLGEELPIDGTMKADCRQCAAGYYKDSTTYLCKRCGDSFTSPVGSESSTTCYKVCKAGEELLTGNTGCKPCDRGYYKAAPPTNTDRLCNPCPAGETTQYTGTISPLLCQDLCSDGFELSADKDSCEPCPVGKYRAQGSGKLKCEPCPTGTTTSTAGSATIASCKRDCTLGQKSDTDKCVDCEVGTYQDVPLQDTCKECPSWKTTLAIRSTKYEDCIDPCKDGYQSVNERCVQCERGSYRQQNIQPSCQLCRDKFTTLAPGQDTVDKCVPICSRGRHWDENSDSCVQCESGTYNPIEYQLQCLPCPPGRPISAADFLSCQADCQPGESWNADRQICNWCLGGTYSLGGSTACVSCPAGTYSYIKVGATIADCVTVCNAGYFRPTLASSCQMCPSSRVSNPDRTACVACPVGQEPSSDKGSCVEEGSDWCDGGYEPSLARRRTRCVPCQPGYFRPWGSRERCQQCAKGFYQPLPGQISCISCTNPLYTTEGKGSTSADQCKADFCDGGEEPIGSSCEPCPPGKYKPSGTTGNCLLCPKNSYQDATGQTSCKTCPPGEDTKGEGSTKESDCKEDWCPGGQQPKSGTDKCEECGLGKFKPDGDTGPCRKCDTLHYQDETGKTSCKPCTPTGFHTMNEGSTQASDCSAEWCDPGQSMINGLKKPGQTKKMCSDCGYGKYRTKMDIGCQNCSSGITYSLTAKSPNECKGTCPKGSFINFFTESCDLCDIGEYTEEDNRFECKKCRDGLRTPGKGASSSAMCKENWCPGGLTFDEGQQICVPCGFGKYRRFKMDPKCIECPEGLSTLTNTASLPDDCVSGGARMCREGYLYRDGMCKPCPIGSYSTGNSSGCIECPPGFTTRRAGAHDESLCITMSSQCESKFDLIIAVDLSNSLYHDSSHHIYLHLKPWLKCLIRRLDIHPYRVRVSILKYAGGVSPLVDLNDRYSAERICSLINRGLKPSKRMSVNTAGALSRAYDMFRHQGRPGVQKHVLLITDDTSDNPTHAAQIAKHLRDRQVHITVVGPDMLEGAQLASSTYSQFIAPDYLHLPSDYNVVRAVCRPR
ncbi:proprotein convertase subtilisin/kexin type 5-like [Mercenaria mercenaria]|uniref:proprotein convertase subtilisin/kexin type 5-like n=1 Tax=Mercenaria mercenaria TaxID=6596 RepID=UPI00234F577D|nr:proprotein convertase subtilisin/kexin type 5-like [Mercenaria mercenaria]